MASLAAVPLPLLAVLGLLVAGAVALAVLRPRRIAGTALPIGEAAHMAYEIARARGLPIAYVAEHASGASGPEAWFRTNLLQVLQRSESRKTLIGRDELARYLAWIAAVQ